MLLTERDRAEEARAAAHRRWLQQMDRAADTMQAYTAMVLGEIDPPPGVSRQLAARLLYEEHMAAREEASRARRDERAAHAVLFPSTDGNE